MPYNRPYYKKRKRYRKKGYYKKRAMSRYRKPYIGKTLFGNRKTVKLRYQDNFQLQVGVSSVPNTLVFRANSVFDPDQSGTGHQPRGFDQIMPLFQHFTVIGSKCSVWFSIPNADEVNQPIVCGIDLRAIPQIQTTLNNLIEDRNCRYMVQSPNSSATLLENKFSAKGFFSVTNPLDRGNLRGNGTTNPIEQASYHIFAANTNPASLDIPPIDVLVVINYIVTFHEPLNPTMS